MGVGSATLQNCVVQGDVGNYGKVGSGYTSVQCDTERVVDGQPKRLPVHALVSGADRDGKNGHLIAYSVFGDRGDPTPFEGMDIYDIHGGVTIRQSGELKCFNGLDGVSLARCGELAASYPDASSFDISDAVHKEQELFDGVVFLLRSASVDHVLYQHRWFKGGIIIYSGAGPVALQYIQRGIARFGDGPNQKLTPAHALKVYDELVKFEERTRARE